MTLDTDDRKSRPPDLGATVDRHLEDRDAMFAAWDRALTFARMTLASGDDDAKYRAGWLLNEARAKVDEFDVRHAAFVIHGLEKAATLLPTLLAGGISDIALSLTAGRMQTIEGRIKELEREVRR